MAHLVYTQSYWLDPQQSNNQKRVVTMTLIIGKTLDPVPLKVPRHADSTDVDGLLENLATFVLALTL